MDVNASGLLSNFLLELGHDVAFVNLVDPKMSDDAILEWAVREERIIITTDSDFEQMIWLQERMHCGVLRLENLPRQERITLFREVLTNYVEDLELGAVIIATQKKIRIRKNTKILDREELT
jgi:predicted nuclease of predicted toxin-antitoxin system